MKYVKERKVRHKWIKGVKFKMLFLSRQVGRS
jgi:hypothetical protein